MAKRTATATEIKKDPIYEFEIEVGKEQPVIVYADRYQLAGDSEEQLDFFNDEDIIASFKKWEYVIRGESTSS